MSDLHTSKGIFQKKIQDYQIPQIWDEEESNQALDMTQSGKWRFGAFSKSTFSGLESSDQKKFSEWSQHQVIQNQQTPEKHRVACPMTPEQLTSNNGLKNEILVRSKSINASGQVPDFFVDGPQDIEGDSNYEQSQKSSSIFSTQPYEQSPVKEFKPVCLNFLDNMLDSSSDEEEKKVTPRGELSIQFNSMNLFAFGQEDTFAQAFQEEVLSPEDQQILMSLEFYCFDQAGCRNLQTKIQQADFNSENKSKFYRSLVDQMLPILPSVMVNQFGNYLCQKIIEMADPETLNKIVMSTIGQIVNISLNIHGTRAIQTLIDKLARYILEDNQSSNKGLNHFNLTQVINALNTEVVELTMDMHGNHVIQAFLMIFKASESPSDIDTNGSEVTSQYTQFIFEACMQNCVEIGMHKHGCCVMQRCLEKGTRNQKLELAKYIIDQMDYLIEDPYGNYLVQNVLKLDDSHKNELIFKQIAKDFIRLSQLKFSSNVIEKCLSSGNHHIEKIFKGTFEDDDKQLLKALGHTKNLKTRVHFIVQSLIYNQFGNYVLQKALNVISDENLKREILYTIKSLQPSLMQVKHGQKVLAKLSKTYPEIFRQSKPFGQNTQLQSQMNSFNVNSVSFKPKKCWSQATSCSSKENNWHQYSQVYYQ